MTTRANAPVKSVASALPDPRPGIPVTIPLEALPAYLALHRLEPTGMKPNGILLVRKITKGAK